MTSNKQSRAAIENIKKAQAAWKNMTHRERALAQPQGRDRAKPGSTGKGKFYRIDVRPKSQFVKFRIQDVGERGGLERLAGRRSSGSWDTASWLVAKDRAVLEDGCLTITDPKAQTVLKQIRGPIHHIRGDIFRALPRKNIPEKEKPTVAMIRSRHHTI